MIEEYKPFRINFKNGDLTIFSVRNGILCIFFRNDFGWLNVPENMVNRTYMYIKKKGITYIDDVELQELANSFSNGHQLLGNKETKCT